MSTRCRTGVPTTHADSRSRSAACAWYRQPIVWLGAAVFACSLAGCVWLIVASSVDADATLPVDGLTVLKVPLSQPPPDAKP